MTINDTLEPEDLFGLMMDFQKAGFSREESFKLLQTVFIQSTRKVALQKKGGDNEVSNAKALAADKFFGRF